MDTTWVMVVIAAAGALIGVFAITVGLRAGRKPVPALAEIEGATKQDWTPTGKIDFRVQDVENALPQEFVLRVEETKIIETAMGHDVTQLRWRLATLEEAKRVVLNWNSKQSKVSDQIPTGS